MEMLLTKKKHREDKTILWPILIGPTLWGDNVVQLTEQSVINQEVWNLLLNITIIIILCSAILE